VKEYSMETLLIASAGLLVVRKSWIADSITTFSGKLFEVWKGIDLLLFEPNSRLIQIEFSAFRGSSVKSMKIPGNVEILRSSYFFYCKLFSLISFESNSRLIRI
jgi:hypothetical protein